MDETNARINELLSLMGQRPGMEKIVFSLLAALAFSLIIFISYRLSRDKSDYRPNFAVTLISLVLLSTVLMDLVQSNLALSLGMLGSLSIVRFRTDIKDPRDIGFISWAMAAGLAAATESYVIGISGSIALGICMILSGRLSGRTKEMLLVIRGSKADLDSIGGIVQEAALRNQVKARNIMADSFELVYELCIRQDKSSPLIDRLFALGGIDTVNLLSEAKSS